MMQSLNLPAGLHIRASIAADKPFIATLYKSVRSDLDLVDASLEFIEALKEQQFQAQTDGYGEKFPNAMYFIIEYHHEKVGRAVIDFGHNEIRLVDLALLPAAQGKGIGKAIVQSFMACADQVYTPMSLTVLSHNIAAKALYLKLGFIVESIEPPYEFMIYYPQKRQIRNV